MRIILLSLTLFLLSVGFVFAMDLLVGFPVHVSFSNIWLPYESMVGEEIAVLVLLFLYSAAHYAYIHFRKKKKAQQR
ncbi:hypothetical protein RB620_08775 [Paenibacillus sp. LHD-117]|uniref:hypothetical protein n=1 Tax=Paenibacillus sp. LHD-117 TaxID=3071412 RepID=UPI0027DF5B55|nr:hypothetical protein [Paenibacillus sp. LHD-117]MDQ6419524.1 hypothetical protein [Paenibacillus sp. LHD-117]